MSDRQHTIDQEVFAVFDVADQFAGTPLAEAITGTASGYAAVPEEVTEFGTLVTAVHALQWADVTYGGNVEALVTRAIANLLEYPSNTVCIAAAKLLSDCWFVHDLFIG